VNIPWRRKRLVVLSYNVCKAKECRLPTLLDTTAVTWDPIPGGGWKFAGLWRPSTWRWVNGCRFMANRYLAVSERVQGYGDQVPGGEWTGSGLGDQIPGGEGTSVGLWRSNNGRWVNGRNRLTNLTTNFYISKTFFHISICFAEGRFFFLFGHQYTFLSQFSLEILNNFELSSQVVLDRYRLRSYGLDWSGSG